MYIEWFKLHCLPFRLRPDPAFLYLEGEGARALDGLRLALRESRGVAALLGPPGVGKTTFLQILSQDATEFGALARVLQPRLDPQELLDALAAQFGLVPQGSETVVSMKMLLNYLGSNALLDRRTIILVDDAHEMPQPTLRELLGLGTPRTAPMVILAGEPALRRTLRAEAGFSVAALPITLQELPRMDPATTQRYVEHRLRVAGSAERNLFDSETFAEIQRYTGGTPRLVNTLCDRALTIAEAHSNQRVLLGDILDAARELQWVEFQEPEDPSQEFAGEATTVYPDTPVQSAPNLELEVTYRGVLISTLKLRHGRVLVGRDEGADLRLESEFVSRHHCQFVTTAEAAIIEDLGSTNGIVVNGTKVRAHHLSAGDTIQIGGHMIICRGTGVIAG
jgi:general secretion pathway protein A